MTRLKELGIAAGLATVLASVAIAQDDTGSPGQMMDGESGMTGTMMDGDMSGMESMEGMMSMMKMMRQMGPMMKACTEMMEAMNASMNETPPSSDKG